MHMLLQTFSVSHFVCVCLGGWGAHQVLTWLKLEDTCIEKYLE